MHSDLVWDCSVCNGWAYGKYDLCHWCNGKIDQVAQRGDQGRIYRAKEFGNRRRGQQRQAQRAAAAKADNWVDVDAGEEEAGVNNN
eukprot:269295-Alexandrium_andersonii.AAC.1